MVRSRPGWVVCSPVPKRQWWNLPAPTQCLAYAACAHQRTCRRDLEKAAFGSFGPCSSDCIAQIVGASGRDKEWAQAHLAEIEQRIARIDQRREELREIAGNLDHLQQRYATLSLQWDEWLRRCGCRNWPSYRHFSTGMHKPSVAPLLFERQQPKCSVRNATRSR
jgi:hypothetical protein